MVNKKELNALVYLLDDTDEEVVRNVTDKILSMGQEVIPLLENHWDHAQNEVQLERIEQIIHQIQFNTIALELENWVKSEDQDLFEGFYILSKFQYPNISKQEMDNSLNKIKLDAWLEMRNDMTSLEKVRVLNHVFYQIHGFSGNTSNYHAPQNSFLNTVLETHRGNPISLSIIYSIVAQRMNIPVFGVNLPQHFILAYKDDTYLELPQSPMQQNFKLHYDIPGEVLFYINPFNRGLVFSKQNIDMFLSQLKIESDPSFFEPCANVEILKRVIRNLHFSFTQSKESRQKMEELSQFMIILGGSLDFSSTHEDEGGEEDEG